MSDEEHRDTLLDEEAAEQTIAEMAREIVSRVERIEEVVLVVIHRRGVPLARRLAERIRETAAVDVPTGSLDITLYRDDLMQIGPRPVVGETRLPVGGVDGRTVVIVDDVLFTGRTVRAALDELADFGRPHRILLCVLVDRGGRELPIHADVIGVTAEVASDARVEVLVPEIDGRLGAEILRTATS
jgi:pyrimidine operon attenuation protein / uracil phosphoribosyltransferase